MLFVAQKISYPRGHDLRMCEYALQLRRLRDTAKTQKRPIKKLRHCE